MLSFEELQLSQWNASHVWVSICCAAQFTFVPLDLGNVTLGDEQEDCSGSQKKEFSSKNPSYSITNK